MGKIVLDVDQMKHLKDLGVDTSKAYFGLFPERIDITDDGFPVYSETQYVLYERNTESDFNYPTFTLQDILDLLPVCIMHENNKYELCIKRMIFEGGIKYAVFYQQQNDFEWYVMQSYEELIDASYEMLCWCAENGIIETKKDKL